MKKCFPFLSLLPILASNSSFKSNNSSYLIRLFWKKDFLEVLFVTQNCLGYIILSINDSSQHSYYLGDFSHSIIMGQLSKSPSGLQYPLIQLAIRLASSISLISSCYIHFAVSQYPLFSYNSYDPSLINKSVYGLLCVVQPKQHHLRCLYTNPFFTLLPEYAKLKSSQHFSCLKRLKTRILIL